MKGVISPTKKYVSTWREGKVFIYLFIFYSDLYFKFLCLFVLQLGLFHLKLASFMMEQ